MTWTRAGCTGHDMQPESSVGASACGFQDTFIDHQLRAVVAFFTRLEHEYDVSWQLFWNAGQHACGTSEHCSMQVMSAGMHDARKLRSEWNIGFFKYWQGIHVSSKQYDRFASVPRIRGLAPQHGSN